MARKPIGNVATSKTITLRLTDDDHALIQRQVAKHPDLPERSMSALLRRLVMDAQEGPFRALPPDARTLLEALVKDRAEELRRLDVPEASADPWLVIARLIRDAAKAKGITTSPEHAAHVEPKAAPAIAQVTSEPTEPKAPPAKVATPDGKLVHAALLAAMKEKRSQRSIAKAAQVDPGQLSRFAKQGTGLSAESLTKLSEVLQKKA